MASFFFLMFCFRQLDTAVLFWSSVDNFLNRPLTVLRVTEKFHRGGKKSHLMSERLPVVAATASQAESEVTSTKPLVCSGGTFSPGQQGVKSSGRDARSEENAYKCSLGVLPWLT